MVLGEGQVILTAHQGQYLPWLGLFAKIAQADLFCLLDTVQYERKSFENRNWIKTQQGRLMLTVPVESTGHFEKTGGEIRIVRTGWARKHLRSIELAYGKAPYFKDNFEGLKAILEYPYEKLVDLNRAILAFGLERFGIQTPFVMASNHAFVGHKSDLIIDMCRKLDAGHYIFGALGEDYADRDAFARAGIMIEFQNYQHPVYEQQWGQFVPNMSFVDCLFNCGPKAKEIFRGQAV